jgi:hypothetical protein
MFDYPPEFSKHARNAVETEKIRAAQALEAERPKLPAAEFGNPPKGLVGLVVTYILLVFVVFATQACETGHQHDWALDRLRSKSMEFLREFTIEARFEKGYYEGCASSGHRIQIKEMTSDVGASILPSVMRDFEKSRLWTEYEELLLAYAGRNLPTESLQPEHPMRVGINPKARLKAIERAEMIEKRQTAAVPDQTQGSAIVALLDRIVEKRNIIIEGWAQSHGFKRTTVFDWKALRLAGRPLKGKVSNNKGTEIEKAIEKDLAELGLTPRTDSD